VAIQFPGGAKSFG
jgi:hypothetical protein